MNSRVPTWALVGVALLAAGAIAAQASGVVSSSSSSSSSRKSKECEHDDKGSSDNEEKTLADLKRIYHYGRRNDLIVQAVSGVKSIKPDNSDITKLGLKPGYKWHHFASELRETLAAEKTAKAVFLIRHGEGIHNVAERELGSEYWETVEALSDKYFDANLNEVGLQQCRVLSGAVSRGLKEGLEIDAIIVSPLTRAIETAQHGLAEVWGKVPTFAVELCRERFGKNQCDKRKSVSQLKEEFPEVNFDLFMESEEDNWFTPKRESDEEVEARIALFYNWLIQTPWKSIAIVGHSSYMAHSIQFLGQPYHWPANCELVPLIIRQIT